MAVQERYRNVAIPRPGGVLAGGIYAGLIAGLVMAAFTMVVTWALGMGFFAPLRLIAGLVYGVNALVFGAGPLFWGAVIHFAAAAALGVIFASFIRPSDSGSKAFGWGLAYGVAIWLVMTYVVLPLVNPMMRARVDLMPGWWFLSHLVFGGMLYLAPRMRRQASERAAIAESRRSATLSGR